jgi:archaellum component FlaF (FlaF/FlaG flagellin family)
MKFSYNIVFIGLALMSSIYLFGIYSAYVHRLAIVSNRNVKYYPKLNNLSHEDAYKTLTSKMSVSDKVNFQFFSDEQLFWNKHFSLD